MSASWREDQRRHVYQFGKRQIVILWNRRSLKTALFTPYNIGQPKNIAVRPRHEWAQT